MPEKQKQSTISLPDNSADIISEILVLYKLETEEEMLKKIEKREKTQAEKITDILKQIANKELDYRDISKELKTQLKIKSAKAEKITQEIKKRLISDETRDGPVNSSKTKFLEENKKRQQKISTDTYRESIE